MISNTILKIFSVTACVILLAVNCSYVNKLLKSSDDKKDQPSVAVPLQEDDVVPTEIVIEDDSKFVHGITATKGGYEDKVVLSWVSDSLETTYSIERSFIIDSNYSEIARINGSLYEDKTAERGVKYWYRITPVPVGSVPEAPVEVVKQVEPSTSVNSQIKPTGKYDLVSAVDFSNEKQLPVVYKIPLFLDYGYVKTQVPQSENFDKLMKVYNKPAEKFSSKEEKDRANNHLSILKEYYINKVQLNMVLIMARPYFNSGKLLVMRNFRVWTLNYSEKEIVLFDSNYNSAVLLKSSKFSRFIKKYYDTDKELIDRMIANGIAFCIYMGEKEVKDEKGVVRILPVYDTVGFATQYYKEYADWRNATVMIGTGRDDLKKELAKIKKAPAE